MSAPTLPLDSAAVTTEENSAPAIVFEDVALAFARMTCCVEFLSA